MVLVTFAMLLYENATVAQENPLTIKIKKDNIPDSIYFDQKEFAIYSKTSGPENRFKTVKVCTLQYFAKKPSGKIYLSKNYLPGNIKKMVHKRWRKKIEIKVTGIILKADIENPKERIGTPITLLVKKKFGLLRFRFGAWGVITPIPTCYVVSISQSVSDQIRSQHEDSD